MTLQNLIANLSTSNKIILGISIGIFCYISLRLLVYFANKDVKNLKSKKLSERQRIEQQLKESQI